MAAVSGAIKSIFQSTNQPTNFGANVNNSSNFKSVNSFGLIVQENYFIGDCFYSLIIWNIMKLFNLIEIVLNFISARSINLFVIVPFYLAALALFVQFPLWRTWQKIIILSRRPFGWIFMLFYPSNRDIYVRG